MISKHAVTFMYHNCIMYKINMEAQDEQLTKSWIFNQDKTLKDS